MGRGAACSGSAVHSACVSLCLRVHVALPRVRVVAPQWPSMPGWGSAVARAPAPGPCAPPPRAHAHIRPGLPPPPLLLVPGRSYVRPGGDVDLAVQMWWRSVALQVSGWVSPVVGQCLTHAQHRCVALVTRRSSALCPAVAVRPCRRKAQGGCTYVCARILHVMPQLPLACALACGKRVSLVLLLVRRTCWVAAGAVSARLGGATGLVGQFRRRWAGVGEKGWGMLYAYIEASTPPRRLACNMCVTRPGLRLDVGRAAAGGGGSALPARALGGVVAPGCRPKPVSASTACPCPSPYPCRPRPHPPLPERLLWGSQLCQWCCRPAPHHGPLVAIAAS